MPNPYHDERGRFTTGGVKLKELTGTRVFAGKAVPIKTELSKLQTGELGEKIALAYFAGQGMPDVRSINVGRNNAPVDAVGDHTALEVKTGLASNGQSAQQWRATIGQPGPAEAAWLRTAGDDAKRAWNERKAADIIARKQAALRDLAKEFGVAMRAKTVGVILDPDRKRADLHVFDGFHSRIGWNSAQAKDGYVGTYSYK